MQVPALGILLTPNPVHRVWGQRRILKLPNPAEGKDFTITRSESMLWRVISLTATLVTGAEAGNRVPGLQVSDGDGNALMVVGGTQEQATGLTRRVTFAPEVSTDTTIAAGPNTINIPWLLLLPGYSISTLTNGLLAKDQWTGVTLWVEEFEQEQHHPLAALAAEVSEILRLREAATLATG